MIHWIALGILCIALVAVSYYSPKIGFSVLAVIALSLTALYYFDSGQEEKPEFEVDPSQIVLSNTRATGAYGDSWNYSGRVANNSSRTVTDVRIKITMSDCESESAAPENCVVIGEQVDFVPINIPPRQARDFTNNVSFSNAHPDGAVRWEFELAGVRTSE